MTYEPKLVCLYCGAVVPIEKAPEHTCRPANALGPYLNPLNPILRERVRAAEPPQ